MKRKKSVFAQVEEEAKLLVEEFEEIAGSNQLPEILSGEFLFDDSLAAPSPRSIFFIGRSVLDDPQILRGLEELTEEEGYKAVADGLTRVSRERLKYFAYQEARRLVGARLSYPDEQSQRERWQWDLFIYHLYKSEETGWISQRRIALRCIELLTSLAVCEGDIAALTSLTTAVESALGSKPQPNPTERDITRELMFWIPWVVEQIGEKPSKTEIQEFVRELFPDRFEGRRRAWDKAFAEVEGSVAPDRRRPRDRCWMPEALRDARDFI